ncbi:hypothetical protein QJS04_geneDACA015004 [Acorus gramineus]|uniref:Uncharacterized protein n=1 Tax=Acorus gramineus TaxID=55184 RepID=A0AAV9BXM2_ACOGR|nr:hypothetical protein QJS04_geneDACA015004 [Acorus gramineus]
MRIYSCSTWSGHGPGIPKAFALPPTSLLRVIDIQSSRCSEDPPYGPNQPAMAKELTDWQNGWDEDDNDVTETRRSEFEDPFWEKLRLAAERKVGPTKAEQFCKAFQRVHKKLVHEELTVDAAQRIMDSSASAARAT